MTARTIPRSRPGTPTSATRTEHLWTRTPHRTTIERKARQTPDSTGGCDAATALRSSVHSVSGGIAAAAVRRSAQAQGSYPNKSMRIIVGYAAGGGTDVVARVIGEKLAERLGQPVVIENKPGGGARLAVEYVATRAARRLHHPDRRRQRAQHQPADLQDRLFAADELRAADHRDRDAADPAGAARSSGEDRDGARGLGQGQSRQVELRHHRAGLHAAGRAVQAAHRRAGCRDHLQERGRRRDRADERRVVMGDVHAAGHRQPGQGGQAPRACGHHRDPLAGPARYADHEGGSASTSTSPTGTDFSCPPARRSRSPTGLRRDCAISCSTPR